MIRSRAAGGERLAGVWGAPHALGGPPSLRSPLSCARPFPQPDPGAGRGPGMEAPQPRWALTGDGGSGVVGARSWGLPQGPGPSAPPGGGAGVGTPRSVPTCQSLGGTGGPHLAGPPPGGAPTRQAPAASELRENGGCRCFGGAGGRGLGDRPLACSPPIQRRTRRRREDGVARGAVRRLPRSAPAR